MNIYEQTLPEYIESMKGTKVEHSYYTRKGQLIHNNQDAVIHAIQLGKTIKPEVIASMPYPLPLWARSHS